jgi:flavin-dependent dehydrogenase
MTTGGGVYYGLLAAGLAADVLEQGLRRGRLGARHLSQYERLWLDLLGPEQRAGQKLRRFASSLSDETLDEMFRVADRRGLSQYLLDLVDFDWHARPGMGLVLTVLAAAPTGRGLRWLKRLVR